MKWIQILLWLIDLAALAFSVYYSYRYRLQKNMVLRGLYAARMNISMGILLLSFAVTQIALYELHTVRVVLSLLFFLIGLFNLFAGLRNHIYFTHLQSDNSPEKNRSV